MGLLIDGHWSSAWYDTSKNEGQFVRDTARYRNWVTADGSAGPSGKSGFAAESGRYHLYLSYACPWAHRTLIFRHLKGLDLHIVAQHDDRCALLGQPGDEDLQVSVVPGIHFVDDDEASVGVLGKGVHESWSCTDPGSGF